MFVLAHQAILSHFHPCRPTFMCSILHKNGPTTYNEHFTAYNIMALVCAGWLHEVQWVLWIAFWSMDMTGVYACLFEAVCDVTTVPSHLKVQSAGSDSEALSYNRVQVYVLWSVAGLSRNPALGWVFRSSSRGEKRRRSVTPFDSANFTKNANCFEECNVFGNEKCELSANQEGRN